MSACEKCWRDSRGGDDYFRLRDSRKDNPCTPEEQAGPDAKPCPSCGRLTLHQYTGEPMCGCPNVALTGERTEQPGAAAGPSVLSAGLGVESRAHELCRFIEMHSGKAINLNERAFTDLCHLLYDVWEHGIRYERQHQNLKTNTPNAELRREP